MKKMSEKKFGSGHNSGQGPKSKDPACPSAGVVFGHPTVKKGGMSYPKKSKY